MSLTYRSEVIVFKKMWVLLFVSNNGTPHINLLIVKVHFKTLSLINTATIPTVLNNDIPTQLEPTLNNNFLVTNAVIYCPQNQVRKCVILS
jgi:hypothetical protein